MQSARLNPLPRTAMAVGAVAVMSAAMVTLPAAAASAHVRVLSEGAEAGRPATLRFRVPSEKEFSTTVRIDIALPEGVTADSVPEIEGWTISRTPQRHIVWTARAGHEIRPAETQTFTVRAKPLPNEGVLRFDTAQTYSDGSVVNWNQPSAGGREPDFPSPELVLDPAAVREAPPPAGAAPKPPAATEPAGAEPAGAEAATGAAEEGGLPVAVWAVGGVLAGGGLAVLLRRLLRASAGRHG
ncbi:DUF1775 domain-containing protein [Actinomadura geliboluensis]|uniref:DUF1775 domain-containing protein n=1 Tax=Actinomadura geliboluensis TaxID=882440 RepID=A0A5S4H7C6_9ACTN|nr:DUF1775 domain-containing protein [Actinomadura geliboluensis]TMR40641.1 DUF1775 domain-containing protein [Actinomadura geliboluensis]